jgi:hypothetical protein
MKFSKDSAFAEEAKEMQKFFDKWHEAAIESVAKKNSAPEGEPKLASSDQLRWYLNEARHALDNGHKDEAMQHIESALHELD